MKSCWLNSIPLQKYEKKASLVGFLLLISVFPAPAFPALSAILLLSAFTPLKQHLLEIVSSVSNTSIICHSMFSERRMPKTEQSFMASVISLQVNSWCLVLCWTVQRYSFFFSVLVKWVCLPCGCYKREMIGHKLARQREIVNNVS